MVVAGEPDRRDGQTVSNWPRRPVAADGEAVLGGGGPQTGQYIRMAPGRTAARPDRDRTMCGWLGLISISATADVGFLDGDADRPAPALVLRLAVRIQPVVRLPAGWWRCEGRGGISQRASLRVGSGVAMPAPASMIRCSAAPGPGRCRPNSPSAGAGASRRMALGVRVVRVQPICCAVPAGGGSSRCARAPGCSPTGSHGAAGVGCTSEIDAADRDALGGASRSVAGSC